MKCIRSFIIGLLCGAFIFGGTAVLANSDVLAKITSQIFFWNNEAIELEAYNINGYNYVRLRDVAKIFGVNVEYYEDTNSVYLGEDKKEETPKPEHKVLDGNAYAKEDYSQNANQAIFNRLCVKYHKLQCIAVFFQAPEPLQAHQEPQFLFLFFQDVLPASDWHCLNTFP